jgi:hypothetical protein
MNPTDPPRYEPYTSPQPAAGTMACPKWRRTDAHL